MNFPNNITLAPEKLKDNKTWGHEIMRKISSDDLHLLTDDELYSKVQDILLDQARNGDERAIFLLGQLYYEKEDYEKARRYYKRASDFNIQAKYQLGYLLYQGLGGDSDLNGGFELMVEVANLRQKNSTIFCAAYNVGLAYFQGFGPRFQSDDDAEKWWLVSADDGNPKACIKAQTALGMFYSRPDSRDLRKAFFWHSEACGNGSLESQGCLGMMYMYGLGIKKNLDSAFECLREAADRGNVYAMGSLILYYYNKKLFSKAAELAVRVANLTDVDSIANETQCVPTFIRQGIAVACFIYGRCLYRALGVRSDKNLAAEFYSRCYKFDPNICAYMQADVQKGVM